MGGISAPHIPNHKTDLPPKDGMNCSKICLFIVIFLTTICIDGCKKDSSEKSINEFLFEASKNSGLKEDIVTEIDDNDRITAILPSGVNVQSLVATFSYTGKQIVVNNKVQTSGVSANDFSTDVEYDVRAESCKLTPRTDGSRRVRGLLICI